MPEQPKSGESGSRFEKLSKSVLETNHPFFGKIKKELPVFQQKIRNRGGSTQERLLRILQKPLVRQWALILVCSFLLSFFIFRQIVDPFLDYKLGEVAQRHLIAPYSMEMLDEETTEAKRKSASDAVPMVFDYDRRVAAQTRQKIQNAFAMVRKDFSYIFSGPFLDKSSDEMERLPRFLEAKRAFDQILEVETGDKQFEALVRMKFSPRVERILFHLITEMNMNLILSSKEVIASDSSSGITLIRLDDNGERRSEMNFKNLETILDLESARIQIDEKSRAIFSNFSNKNIIPYVDAVVGLGKKLLNPNLRFNRLETESRKKAAAEEIKPVIAKITKGESLVQYGENINKRHLSIFRQMEQNSQNQNSAIRVFFTTIFLAAMLFSVMNFLDGGVGSYKIEWKDMMAISFLMVTIILMMKGIQFLATEALIEKFPQLPFDFYYFLVPVAAGPMIVRMLMDKGPALIFSVVLALVGGILLERNFFYSAYVLASSLLGASVATSIKTRSVIYKAGLAVGVLNVAMIAAIVANTRNAASLSMLWNDVGWIFWAGMIGGFFASVMVVSLVPLVELISGRTSDLRLLELANMNHPLLRDLMVKAPGTYHHCIVIGSLVEAAAEAIGANPLMARVMAYYHDVGKMERPLYFIENQGGGYNRHDGLQPHMSAMIIREHVKRGQELGRKYKLPQPIIDAMSEHHGSSTIWYFFNKAKGMAEDPDSILESDYQYDGKKPQSKETALVMLGDVVEAATRSVPDPSPMRLSGVVKNILNKYFAEGQLSECDLTLKDLDQIAKSFLDVLIGIYHARIEYGVSSIKESRKKNGGEGQKLSAKAVSGGAVVGSPGQTSYPKPFPLPGSGSGGSKKG